MRFGVTGMKFPRRYLKSLLQVFYLAIGLAQSDSAFANSVSVIEIDSSETIIDADKSNFIAAFKIGSESNLKHRILNLGNDSYIKLFIATSDSHCDQDVCLLAYIYKEESKPAITSYIYARPTIRVWTDYNPRWSDRHYGVVEFDVGQAVGSVHVYAILQGEVVTIRGYRP